MGGAADDRTARIPEVASDAARARGIDRTELDRANLSQDDFGQIRPKITTIPRSRVAPTRKTQPPRQSSLFYWPPGGQAFDFGASIACSSEQSTLCKSATRARQINRMLNSSRGGRRLRRRRQLHVGNSSLIRFGPICFQPDQTRGQAGVGVFVELKWSQWVEIKFVSSKVLANVGLYSRRNRSALGGNGRQFGIGQVVGDSCRGKRVGRLRGVGPPELVLMSASPVGRGPDSIGRRTNLAHSLLSLRLIKAIYLIRLEIGPNHKTNDKQSAATVPGPRSVVVIVEELRLVGRHRK